MGVIDRIKSLNLLNYLNIRLFLIIFIILLGVYHIITFVPLVGMLKPVLIPLYSDYGHQFYVSWGDFVNQILSLFGKGVASPGAWSALWGWASLCFKRGFLLALWIAFPVVIIMVVPGLLLSLFLKLINVGKAIKANEEAAKAQQGAQDMLVGGSIIGSLGKQARKNAKE